MKHLAENKTKLCTGTRLLVEANQLQYVCRQLRAETRGLSLRYNDVVFRSHIGELDTPAKQCDRFLHQCSQPWQTCIRTIIIKGTHRISALEQWCHAGTIPGAVFLNGIIEGPGLTKVSLGAIEFCRRHPQTTVKHHLADVHGEHYIALFHKALLYQARVRGSVPAQLFGSELNPYYIYLRNASFKTGPIHYNPGLRGVANYRMFPHDEDLEEIEARSLLATNAMLHQAVFPFIEGGMEMWIAEMKRWYLEGF